ncbi:MAG TPA: alpha-amylase family glycosyl hydrolase, partial [Polyangiaceae bacterium LLY-WYZ-15_(1-7)]|nr:alpha-amylase family glycosyl hydrolase [Polyangiaceae bacterium LLY-WYZ-15_(1-7)]
MRAGPLTLLSLLFACGEGGGVPAPTIETHVEDWRDEVIYQVVVDRFENGDPSNDVLDGIGPDPGDLVRHQGGDWEGLRQRLGYIEALGATAIWISPIVANVDRTPREDGYHGYWASDFTRLNPRFG